ncbi:MAG: TIGR01906 family membrane protein [Chloroflexi bacterium]|jgi:integral membrane protein (TIGR01906 family)|nr:TIGR01906 family membrane protein [Chloroflexota bacterium]
MSTESVSARPAGSVLYQAAAWVVTLLVPVALVLTGVRLMMNGTFLRIEYNMPGFPADPYGFSTEDRLYWSQIALDYLLNDEGIDFLGDLRFENGEPVYNERELRHMVDVKVTVQAALRVWIASLALLLLLGLWARLGGWWPAFLHGLGRGGWLTVLMIAFILLFVLLAFGVFFVAFHNVFFAPGTWTFLWSDTLIRLFPERFWRDIFIYVGLIALIGGLALGFGLRRRSSAA